MRGIQIHDRDDRGLLAFDLLEILTAVGIEADGCQWTCQNVECMGHAAAELEALDDKGARFNGDELRRLAGGITQTIDGEFIGTAEVNDTVVLVIRAIDSTYWEVFGNARIIEQLGRAFRDTAIVIM